MQKTEKMKKVLFVCVGNSARSIVAEALFNAMAPEGWEALSGGTKPASRISGKSIAVLDESGVKVEKERPSPLDQDLAKNAEIGITMGCEVEDECPGQPIEKYRETRKVEGLVEELNAGRKR